MGQNLKNQLLVLNQICKAVNQEVNEDELFRKVYDLLRKLMPVDSFCLGSYDKKRGGLDWKFLIENGESRETTSETVHGIVETAMTQDECLLVSLDEVGKSTKSILGKNNSAVRSIIISPIFIGSEARGVVALKSYGRKYNEEDAHLLSIVCSQLRQVRSKTEQRELGEIIEEKEHLQSVVELAGSVGHELNQPLTGISGYCALIKEDIDGDDPIYKDIEQIEKQAARLERLVYKFQTIVDLEKRKSPGSENR